MKTIKIYYCDFWDGFDKETFFITKILSKKFNLVFDDKNPDYIIHSCFGKKHLFYDGIKISFCGENITPDFNIDDYALSFDYISFEDRYLRLPLYRLGMQESDITQKDRVFFEKEMAKKTKFCNFIYSNNTKFCATPARDKLYDILDTYKSVDSGGRHRNTLGYRVEDKRAWQREYKFSIACENSSKSGYTTEKIFEPLQAHTIPIYWGNPRIAEEFNPKRFINCHEYNTFEEVLEVVKQLDNDDKKYLEMLSQPWFLGEKPYPVEQDLNIINFIIHIFDQPYAAARRTTKYGWTACYLLENRNAFKNNLFRINLAKFCKRYALTRILWNTLSYIRKKFNKNI